MPSFSPSIDDPEFETANLAQFESPTHLASFATRASGGNNVFERTQRILHASQDSQSSESPPVN